MLRHDATTPSSQNKGHDTESADIQQDRHIFAFIVEIQRAAGFDIPRELPIIALCDTASPVNWISSRFVTYLENLSPASLTYTKRPARRKANEVARITIRWSCGRLGQADEEGTFLIEPRAQFKILFGCALNPKPPSRMQPVYNSSPYFRRKSKPKESNFGLSEETANSFRQGVYDGKLLPLRAMPPISEDDTFRSVADLEVELDFVWRSYSFTDSLLRSDFINDENSSCYTHYPSIQSLSSMELSIPSCSEPDTYGTYFSESPSASISEDLRSQNLSHKLRRDHGGLQQLSQLGSWVGQSSADEPQPWAPSIVQPVPSMFSFTRCHTLTPEQRLTLAAKQAATEATSTAYWEWDEEAENYKHCDEGSTEPVWYNPP